MVGGYGRVGSHEVCILSAVGGEASLGIPVVAKVAAVPVEMLSFCDLIRIRSGEGYGHDG